MNRNIAWTFAVVLLIAAPAGARKKEPPPSPLDQYITGAQSRAAANAPSTPGSLWSPASRYSDLASDLRAGQVDDLVTILVSESASAVSSGTTKTARQSTVKSTITAAGGLTRAAGPWANLAGANSQTQLDGQGTTTRQSVLTTTLSARVAAVLPNGNLVVEGSRELQVNAERQLISVRGVVRPVDLGPGNTVASNRVAQLEVRINGKGVVNDAVRRPFFHYRVLLGLLPF